MNAKEIVWWAWVLAIEGIAVFATLMAAVVLAIQAKRAMAKAKNEKMDGRSKDRKKK
jgi:hypothetical protein